MKQLVFTLLLPLLLILAGCGVKQDTNSSGTAVSTKTAYSSDTSAEDCCLCGSIENPISPYWGQNNLALISLNTFEIMPLEINCYDRVDGRLIKEYAGTVSFAVGSNDDGFSASLLQDSDRGYATGSLDFYSDDILDVSKAANFLCANCLNEILPSQIGQCFGVGAVNLATKEVRIFEERLRGFALGDFYIDCDLQGQDSDKLRMPNRENPTDSRDFIAGTFLLCSFEGDHFTSLTAAQQKEFETYFALSGLEEGDMEE